MTQMFLEPELSACIQTQARREYDRILKELLESGDGDEESEQRIELLRKFLESVDFNKLRSEYEPYLVEGKRIQFTLTSSSNDIEYKFKVI